MIKKGFYRHYKGNLYEVIGLGRHSETLEEFVIYRAMYVSPDFGPDAIWLRPLSEFVDQVEVNGKRVPRYAFVGTEMPVADVHGES